ncbi:MAG: hypothetical protein HRF49_04440 [bacterium]|jgi:hypothetical protein
MRRYQLALEIAAIAAFILLVAAFAIPAYLRVKDRVKEAEAKSNLHYIQLGVERYAVSNNGTYPPFLYGGDVVADPLLRGGFITEYPRNPFFAGKRGVEVLEHQAKVDDTLRPDALGKTLGCRFGLGGDKMGNVMPDHRYGTVEKKDAYGKLTKEPTYADFAGYPFYDIWQDPKHPKFFLPGEFFYKSDGPIVAADAKTIDATMPIQPVEVDQYIMGLYGARWNRGLDVMGRQNLASSTHTPEEYSTMNTVVQSAGWHFGKNESAGLITAFYSNGVPDSILLLLESGEPIISKQ